MTDYRTPTVVDTNVPINADKVAGQDGLSKSLIEACQECIRCVMENRSLVLDRNQEIFFEYQKNLQEDKRSRQPGIGHHFMKWVYQNQFTLLAHNLVDIHPTKNGESYEEFPDDEYLADFDLKDRKFIAVANAHPNKPPIIQSTDSKWWAFHDALTKSQIRIIFLDEEYTKKMCKKKLGSPDTTGTKRKK